MLQYSRDELPVECPDCGNVNMTPETISRDTYMETLNYSCGVCVKTYKVRITED